MDELPDYWSRADREAYRREIEARERPTRAAPKASPEEFQRNWKKSFEKQLLMMERKKPSDLALHEAGHAVIARRLGIACSGVVIRKDGGVARIAPPRDRDAVRSYAVCVFAGGVACNGMPSGQDMALIWASAETAGFDKAAVAEWRDRAEALVTKHRADIETVAGALEARRSLTGDEIDALIGIEPEPKPVARIRW
jgi:hypothetical protein